GGAACAALPGPPRADSLQPSTLARPRSDRSPDPSAHSRVRDRHGAASRTPTRGLPSDHPTRPDRAQRPSVHPNRARVASCAPPWNTSPNPVVGAKEPATSPRINLEIRYADRPTDTRSVGPGRIIIGRESGDIVLHDPETSALHAELEFTQ